MCPQTRGSVNHVHSWVKNPVLQAAGHRASHRPDSPVQRDDSMQGEILSLESKPWSSESSAVPKNQYLRKRMKKLQSFIQFLTANLPPGLLQTGFSYYSATRENTE